MIASELKIGDTFKRQSFLFKVEQIESDSYKNGTPCILVKCSSNGSKSIDSSFSFKLTTKIK